MDCTVPPESTDLDNKLIFTFGPTLQFEWVTMKQGCFSTAGTLTGSGTLIVGTGCEENDVMVVNLKGHSVEWHPLHSGLHHLAMIWAVWPPAQFITIVASSGTHIDGTVRHFGLKNGKYCVCKWVQSGTMNEKIQNLLLQLLRWQMAESCSHSFTSSRMCASLHFLAACSHQTQTADEWLQPASEASLVCLDCVVTRIKEGQVSIIGTDMGH